MLEGTILGWVFSGAPSSQYLSAPQDRVLNIIERMLNGLRSE